MKKTEIHSHQQWGIQCCFQFCVHLLFILWFIGMLQNATTPPAKL